MSLFKATVQKFKKAPLDHGRMSISDNQRREDTFFTTVAFEDFFVRFAQEQMHARSINVSDNLGEWKIVLAFCCCCCCFFFWFLFLFSFTGRKDNLYGVHKSL